MKLKDLLGGRYTSIEYRTHGPAGEDLLHGYCYWTGAELVSEDGDVYSVEDVISDYHWDSDSDLVVWYQSKWI